MLQLYNMGSTSQYVNGRSYWYDDEVDHFINNKEYDALIYDLEHLYRTALRRKDFEACNYYYCEIVALTSEYKFCRRNCLRFLSNYKVMYYKSGGTSVSYST
jgi:hypothetical protein